MTEWTMFPFEVPRPPQPHQFTEADRAHIESKVGGDLTWLLARYGQLDDVEVDFGPSVEVEDPITYVTVGLEPYELTDGILTVDQLPFLVRDTDDDTGGTVETIGLPGVHSILHEDTDGRLLGSWLFARGLEEDLALPSGIVDSSGNKPDIDELAEICDALTVIKFDYLRNGQPNQFPINPAHYPVPLSNPEFDEIIANL